ncbi:MAG: nucleoside deaminase [Planctomycetes bacterium]|nr:nucleoside deaminase [Planctomycetota bacterium]
MHHETVTIALPKWTENFLSTQDKTFLDIEQRMSLALELAKLNIEHKTGGPFAAAIFEQQTGKLISVGVNLVTSTNCSIAHAEIVAIAIAQKKLETFDLYADNTPRQLVTTTEPCAMCLGAIPWSGIRSVVCGAKDEDARQIGFDEGAKPKDWIDQLKNRNIEVTRNIKRQQAIEILRSYVNHGGKIYNPKKNG